MLAAAAVEAAGLHVVAPPFPLDWTSTDDDYERAVRSALEADDVDAVLVIHAPAVAVGDRRTDRSHRSGGDGCDQAGRRRDARCCRRVAPSGIGGADVRVPRTGRRRARPVPRVLALAHRRGSGGRRVAAWHRCGGRRPCDRSGHRRRARSADAGGDPLRARPLRRGDGGGQARAVRRGRGRGGHDRLPGRRQGDPPSAGPVGAGRRRARSRSGRRRPPGRGRHA